MRIALASLVLAGLLSACASMYSSAPAKVADGVYVGPSDLGLSYGLPPKLDRDEPEILKAYDKILKACQSRGIYAGIHTAGAADAAKCIARGFRLTTLMNDSGMTLYTFDRDAAGSGKSVCNGPCATNWPPLMANDSDSASGDFSIVTRDDGRKQWAFKGKPLYYWAKDAKPGDRTGDGFNGVWRLVRP